MVTESTYLRGDANIPIKSIKDKKLKGTLKRKEKQFREAAEKSVQFECLLPEDSGFLEAEGMEKTFKFTQKEIKSNVDINTQRKMFDLKLDPLGPYTLNYTRNGKYLLIGGKKGHLATFDWKNARLTCELQLNETIRAVQWLHNETMFAVAQKKYTYIYDNTGMELHCLRNHVEVNAMQFLPYHFLLATVGNSGYLKYQDTSTGAIVSEIKTKLGRCDIMTSNPYNSIMNLGHSNGTVTLWSPTMSTPLVKMQCHRGPVKALAIDRGGYYMATSGLDGQMKIWDIRTYKSVHEYYTPTPACSLDISDMGLLGVGFGPTVNVWKDALKTKAKSPYMTHLIPGNPIESFEFCPYEDILGIGHKGGISSLLVPGSGEPNFDSLESNPYQNKKQRQESEVHSLLEKIQPDMITLDPNVVGSLDKAPKTVIAEENKLEWEANHPGEKFVPRHKKRGKSSSVRRYLSKQGNVIDANKMKLKERIEKERAEREKEDKKLRGEVEPAPEWDAFERFHKKVKK